MKEPTIIVGNKRGVFSPFRSIKKFVFGYKAKKGFFFMSNIIDFDTKSIVAAICNCNSSFKDEAIVSDTEFLQDQLNGSMKEIVQFFSKRSHACTAKASRQRFVFHKNELDKIMKQFPNPEWLDVTVEWNDDEKTEVFCYTIDFKKEVIFEENHLKRMKNQQTRIEKATLK